MSCIIVGSGIIGLSLAWELSQRQIPCRVIEQNDIASGCSWAGAGILPPARLETALDPVDRLRGLSHQLYPEWTSRLETETGIDTGFRRCGGIYLARHPGEAASLIGQMTYWDEYGIESHRLTANELATREPALQLTLSNAPNRHLPMAVYVPNECQVRPPRLLAALQAACRKQGVELLSNTRVNRLLTDADGKCVRGVSTTQGDFFADQVALCCGAWASQFADPIGRLPEVFPVRGQVVIFRGEPNQLHSVINEGHRYMLPRDDGILYVGSSEEEVGMQNGTTSAIIHQLKEWAEQLVPVVSKYNVEKTFSGLRPGSMDSFPFLGHSPKCENLYLASGHFRSGLHLACGTAVVLADLMSGKTPSVPVGPFAIGR